MNFFDRYKELGEVPGEVELKQSIRLNTLKGEHKKILSYLKERKVLVEKIPSLRDGFHVLSSEFSIGASIEYLMGYLSMQEEAAQYPVEVLDPKPGESVLDMCAAPGGKTTQIAQWMQNDGMLVAMEPNGMRARKLMNHLERCGVTNCTVFVKDGRQADEFAMLFDRILLDAPCSGNFVSDPEWLEKRDLEGIRQNARLQRQLLFSAAESLKEGGILVYSTCSLEPEENELLLDWFLSEYPEMKLEEIDTPGDPGLTEVFGQKLNPELAKARRFWPWKTGTQGFFVARLRKC